MIPPQWENTGMERGILQHRASKTAKMTLKTVLGQLRGDPVVTGLVVMGSAGRGRLKPASDYDLLVVLKKGPSPCRILFTSIGGRMADVILTSRGMLGKMAGAGKKPFNAGSIERMLEKFIITGKVALDRVGLLGRIRKMRTDMPEPVRHPDLDIYKTWNYINYNLKQAERYALMKDPVSREALNLRLHYSVTAVIVGYLLFRGHEWRGEKEAFKWLSRDAAPFYRLIQGFFREQNAAKKLGIFRLMAREALDPVGGTWPDGVTVVAPVSEHDQETIGKALDEWDALFY